MKNLWPDSFSENDRPTAKSLFEEQGKLLPQLTGGVVFAEVAPLPEMDAMLKDLNNDFAFRFDILGKFLPNYRFNVLMFSHDITLYPVKFIVDEKIAIELALKRTLRGYTTQADSPEALEEFVQRVLRSERLKAVIGSIIRLSK